MEEDMNEHQSEPNSVDIIIKFLSVSEQKNCVQFVFSKGDQAFFYEQYKNLTGFLEDLDDELYNWATTLTKLFIKSCLYLLLL